MKTGSIRKPLRIAILVAILIPSLAGSASVAGDRQFRPAGPECHTDKSVRLTIRIAEAKRNKDGLRYYKSLMRHRRRAASARPLQSSGMTDGLGPRSSD